MTQVDEEAVQKALGELEEGWREFEDEGRDRTPSKAAAIGIPSPDQVRHSCCCGFNSSCMCSHRSSCLLRDRPWQQQLSSVFKGIAAADNSMML